MMRCEDCKEIFEDDEAVYIAEYVDDSNRPAFYTPKCPYCGSEDVEDWVDLGEDEG